MGDSDSQAAGQTAPKAATRRPIAVGFVVLAVVVGGLVYWNRDASPEATPALTAAAVAQTVDKKLEAAAKKAAAAPPRSVEVFRAIAPSLVFIRVSGAAAAAATPDTASDADAPPTTEPDEARRGLGSGVVVNEDGDILTAHHVVADAESIEVTFADGTSAGAQILTAEPENDIAVLRAERRPEVVVPAVLGGGVQVGDEAFAVGHPLGLVGSLSAGVVSGLNRSIPVGDGTTLDDLIQFDAAVNPGSSGGPLLNRAGQVVGIVTALANPSEQGFFVGIGFAVPIATAGGAAGGPPV